MTVRHGVTYQWVVICDLAFERSAINLQIFAAFRSSPPSSSSVVVVVVVVVRGGGAAAV
jgi:hypothetical protein